MVSTLPHISHADEPAMSPRFSEIAIGNPNVADSQLPDVELWIERGLVHNRRRLMKGAAFLIGSASDCDLVLKLPDMPMVHSYLLRSSEGVAIRQLGSVHPVTVNGCTMSSGLLNDGDVIDVGPFKFLVAVKEARLGSHVVRQLVRQVRTAVKTPPLPQLQLFNGEEVHTRST